MGASEHSIKRAGRPVKTEETPEQRKMRKEKERKQLEEKNKAKTAAKKPEEAKPKKDPQENRLKRQTNFLCRVQFRNDLPQVPIEPKLLAVPTSWQRFIQYRTHSLDVDRTHQLDLEPDQAIPLDMLEAPQYAVPSVRPRLAPEDEALLSDNSGGRLIGGRLLGKPVVAKRGNLRGDNFSWLMNTQYISDLQLPAQKGVTEKRYKEMRAEAAAEAQEQHVDERQSQIEAIEASFVSVRNQPSHKTKPHLKPVEVLEVLPDFDRWPSNLVQVTFDAEPTKDLADLESLSEATRSAMESRAVIKSFLVPVEEGEPEKFAAYLLPSEAGLQAIEAGVLDEDQDKSAEEQTAVEYKWMREYHYETKPEDANNDNIVFFFGDGEVKYMPLRTKFALQKKKARGLDSKVSEIARPASISLKRRLKNEDELELEAKAMRMLEQPVYETLE